MAELGIAERDAVLADPPPKILQRIALKLDRER